MPGPTLSRERCSTPGRDKPCPKVSDGPSGGDAAVPLLEEGPICYRINLLESISSTGFTRLAQDFPVLALTSLARRGAKGPVVWLRLSLRGNSPARTPTPTSLLCSQPRGRVCCARVDFRSSVARPLTRGRLNFRSTLRL